MSYQNKRQFIEDRFNVNYAVNHPEMDFNYEGMSFDRPDQARPWVMLILLDSTGQRIEIGPNGVKRSPGILQFNIHTQADKGTVDGNVIADALLGLFADQDFAVDSTTVLRFRVGSYRTLGIRDGKMTGILSIPYLYDYVG